MIITSTSDLPLIFRSTLGGDPSSCADAGTTDCEHREQSIDARECMAAKLRKSLCRCEERLSSTHKKVLCALDLTGARDLSDAQARMKCALLISRFRTHVDAYAKACDVADVGCYLCHNGHLPDSYPFDVDETVCRFGFAAPHTMVVAVCRAYGILGRGLAACPDIDNGWSAESPPCEAVSRAAQGAHLLASRSGEQDASPHLQYAARAEVIALQKICCSRGGDGVLRSRSPCKTAVTPRTRGFPHVLQGFVRRMFDVCAARAQAQFRFHALGRRVGVRRSTGPVTSTWARNAPPDDFFCGSQPCVAAYLPHVTSLSQSDGKVSVSLARVAECKVGDRLSRNAGLKFVLSSNRTYSSSRDPRSDLEVRFAGQDSDCASGLRFTVYCFMRRAQGFGVVVVRLEERTRCRMLAAERHCVGDESQLSAAQLVPLPPDDVMNFSADSPRGSTPSSCVSTCDPAPKRDSAQDEIVLTAAQRVSMSSAPYPAPSALTQSLSQVATRGTVAGVAPRPMGLRKAVCFLRHYGALEEPQALSASGGNTAQPYAAATLSPIRSGCDAPQPAAREDAPEDSQEDVEAEFGIELVCNAARDDVGDECVPFVRENRSTTSWRDECNASRTADRLALSAISDAVFSADFNSTARASRPVPRRGRSDAPPERNAQAGTASASIHGRGSKRERKLTARAASAFESRSTETVGRARRRRVARQANAAPT